VHCSFFLPERKCTSSSNTNLLGPPPSKKNGGPASSQIEVAVQKNQEGAVQSNLTDSGRKWLWGFLAVTALAQLYVVRELLAAFVIFALGFAALAFVVVSLYMLQKSWELAVASISALRRPVINIARVSNMTSVGNMTAVGQENQKAA
jgi:hypothetical protein